MLTSHQCNSSKKPKATIATGLHSDWRDKVPAIPGARSTSQVRVDVAVDSQIGGFNDNDVQDDLPPTADAGLDNDNDVSNHSVSDRYLYRY